MITADWRFAAASYPHALTGGLSVDPAPVWVYAADSQLYLDSTAGGIGGTALANTLHGVTVTISQALDVKRFMNGSNTRFQAQGYGRGLRTTEVAFTFAKSTSALAAAADWLNANAQKRYLALKTISPTLIPTSAVPYSSDLRFAGYWYTRAEATYQQSNSALSLVCRSVYDPTLTYNTWWQAVCARAAL